MAEKYNVQGLKTACRRFLVQHMTSELFVHTAILGYLNNDKILKDRAVQAMVDSDKTVNELEGWAELKKYPELSFEILEYCMSESPQRKRRRLE